MAIIQNFDDNMIERYLNIRGLQYFRDSDGYYCMQFSFNDDWGCELSGWIIRHGNNREILKIIIHSDKKIPKHNWGKAILLCNTGNREKLCPKAYLHYDDESSSTSGQIVLEENINLAQGVHQELFDDYLDKVLSSGLSFWKWLHTENGF